MLVTIEQIAAGADDTVVVRSQLGRFRASWKGNSAPLAGELDVEVSLRGPLNWGEQLELSLSPEAVGIRSDGSIVAFVEKVDPDGVLGIRLAEDAIVLIQPLGEAPRFEVGATVVVKDPRVEIYPTGT